jgi:hypothetical protein
MAPAVATTTTRAGALLDGEAIVQRGRCWAARLRPGVPLLFLGRRQAQMVLTDRRVLVLASTRSREPLERDLVIGKRYDSLQLRRVRRLRPLLQLVVAGNGATEMVFEFGPGSRRVGLALLDRLTGRGSSGVPAAAGALGAPTAHASGGFDEASFWGER